MINRTESEEVLTDRLMSMNFSINVVNYVIGTISLCKQNIIELEKKKNTKQG